jgi:predicted  nucleic acid-binding Zn-ribbon protein
MSLLNPGTQNANLSAGQSAAPPNLQTAVENAHSAVSSVEQAVSSLEQKLDPLVSDMKPTDPAQSQAPMPQPDKLHQYIQQLESRAFSIEQRIVSLLNRIHL